MERIPKFVAEFNPAAKAMATPKPAASKDRPKPKEVGIMDDLSIDWEPNPRHLWAKRK